MNRTSTLVKAAATAIGSAALLVATVTPAHAETISQATQGWASIGTSCAGSYVGGRSNGPFRVDVFYSTTNGGTNCAKLYNNSGTRTYMELKLEKYQGAYAAAWDTGRYISYAGAVRVHGAAGSCVNVWAGANSGGRYYDLSIEGRFCG